MFFKLMVTGDTGHNGLAAQKPVDQEPEAGQESVTSQIQLMVAVTVRGQAVSQEFVTQMIVGRYTFFIFLFFKHKKLLTYFIY